MTIKPGLAKCPSKKVFPVLPDPDEELPDPLVIPHHQPSNKWIQELVDERTRSLPKTGIRLRRKTGTNPW
jgi:hypothetical protein